MKNSRKIKNIFLVLLCSALTTVLFTNCSENGFTSVGSDELNAEDPFMSLAWHLKNTGQRVFAVNAGKSGEDINMGDLASQGINGSGVTILVSDDGVQDTHEDLSSNFNYSAQNSKDYSINNSLRQTGPPKQLSYDYHGTAVAGLIAAVSINGKGARGVASLAKISSYNFLSAGVNSDANDHEQFSSAFDVVNMSWGWPQLFLTPPDTLNEAAMSSAVTNGRGGKGTVLVKSSGNSFIAERDEAGTQLCVGSSNFDADNTTPYTIMVGALAANGEAATYSSGGSNLWISSFGGMDGRNNPAIFTTDLSGCTYGLANSKSSLAFDRGGNGNSNCNYTVSFNGTSSAAPILSGVVALMLQANPQLTWRDVKYILAKTAVPVDYSTTDAYGHPLAGTSHVSFPTQTVWEYPWVENDAGFKFHNYYGFGKVDAQAAVNMAKSTTQYLSKTVNTSTVAGTVTNGAIATYTGTPPFVTVENTTTVSANVLIEGVQLSVDVSGFSSIGGLHIELENVTTGTKSILVNAQTCLSSTTFRYGGTSMVFLSNAFYRESSAGQWRLRIKNTAAPAGTLTGYTLKFIGDTVP